jgi:hypothetical protein
METSLHRSLKEIYAGDGAATEVRLGGYRIDAVVRKRLIEVQHGSLSSISRKIQELLQSHRVLVVKPIVVRKVLIKQPYRGAGDGERRQSPRQGGLLDLFHELIYFTRVFPHQKLVLETPLVEIEEWRYPGHGRRRRWRKNDFEVEDQKLVSIHGCATLRSAADLWNLLGPFSAPTFDTKQLAEALGIRRHHAQRIAYCLDKMGAAKQVGKQGNARIFEAVRRKRSRPAA